MAALVQYFPAQSSNITMLQQRPASASGILHPGSQGQVHQQYSSIGSSHMHRSGYQGTPSTVPTNYRGQTSHTPVPPYTLSSTPVAGLPSSPQRLQPIPHLRPEHRTSSAPSVPTFQRGPNNPVPARARYPAAPSISTDSSSSSDSSAPSSGVTRDDSAIPSTARIATRAPRPHSTIITSASMSSIMPPPHPSPSKPSPDRYRRPGNRQSGSPNNPQQTSTSGGYPSHSGSDVVAVNYLHSLPSQNAMSPNGSHQDLRLQMPPSVANFSQASYNPKLRAAVDDMHLPQSNSEHAKRYRRRSIHSIEMKDHSEANSDSVAGTGVLQGSLTAAASGRSDQQHPLRSSPVARNRPESSHGRHVSAESIASAQSASSRAPPSVCAYPSSPYPHFFIPSLCGWRSYGFRHFRGAWLVSLTLSADHEARSKRHDRDRDTKPRPIRPAATIQT